MFLNATGHVAHTIDTGADSVSPAGMQAGLDVYCYYAAGTFANGTAVKAHFPGKQYMGIVPRLGMGRASCLDVETGDASPSDARTFVAQWQPIAGETDKPVIYANLSTMFAVKAALASFARSKYYLWVAHWTGVPAIPAGYDGVQYASNASEDKDTFMDYMFGPVTPPPPPPPVDPDHILVDGYELRRPDGTVVPAVVAWWGEAGLTMRQANIPQTLWNQIVWSK